MKYGNDRRRFLLSFLAQYEIRMYAEAVGSLVRQEFPRTWELFNQEQTATVTEK